MRVGGSEFSLLPIESEKLVEYVPSVQHAGPVKSRWNRPGRDDDRSGSGYHSSDIAVGSRFAEEIEQ